jgi:hypothetical protein
MRNARVWIPVLATCLVVTAGGCGADEDIAHVDGASPPSITRATLNRSMTSLIRADFRAAVGAEGPTGLVSEPADYPRCIAAAKLIAPRSFFNQLRLTRPQILERCHLLYRSAKWQALSRLISTRQQAAAGHAKSSDSTAKTTCDRGYVVPGCREYRGTPPPAGATTVLEGLIHGHT